MVSVCLPSDALLQHLPSHLGFSYLGHGVSLHSCSSKAQPLLLALDEGYLLTAALPDLQRGIAPLGPPVPAQPPLLGCGVGPPSRCPWTWAWGCSSRPPPSSHLILCHPLLLLPPIQPSIRVFPNESTLCMRWPKYWCFSLGIIPSKEHPGLISFRMDWLDLLAVQGALRSLLQHHSSKASILWHSAFFTVQLSHPYMTTGKTIALTRWKLFTWKLILFQVLYLEIIHLY